MKLFLITFFVFSFLLYAIHTPFHGEDIHYHHLDDYLEESYKYIEQKAEDEETAVPQNIPLLSAEEKTTEKKKKIIFLFKPEKFQKQAEELYKKPIMQALNSTVFSSKIQDIVIILYEQKNYVRGNMKNKVLRLYDPHRIGNKETFAVFMHELGHYIDLYHFKKENDYDISHEFYNISWETTKISRAGQDQNDFVSGYAATNSYEDFSESFLFFILHNKKFLEKAEDSNILKEKYDFLAQRLFPSGIFQGSDFGPEKVNNYNRDITKLDFSLENFLEYMKKSI